jgi:hypothetical protein
MEPRVKDDTGTKLIDLRYNDLEEEDLLHFLKAFRQNDSILTVDIRHNPGHTENIKKRLALCLLKNIEVNYKNNKIIKKQWVRKDVIFIDPESKKLKL